MSKNYPPADIQPQLWSILGLAASLPETKKKTDTAALPLTPSVAHDWPAEALAYLAKLGRRPAADIRFTSAARRYLNGPLIVGSRSWGDLTPGWLRDAVQVARLALVMAGEDTEASQEEAVAYLMAASLAAPLDHDWARVYFWLCSQVLPRWGRITENDFLTMLGAAPSTLTNNQADALHALRIKIRRDVEGHASAGRQP